MSHVAKYKTSMGTVNKAIFEMALKAAMEDYAKETKGKVVKQVTEGHYDLTEVMCGVSNNRFRSGIGFRLTNKNEVEMCLQAYDRDTKDQEEVKGLVQQYYTLVCTELALRQKGYVVQRQKSANGTWEIVGTMDSVEEFV